MSILQEESVATADGQLKPTLQSPPKIDLLTCTPDGLSAWLLAHRFQDDAMNVASFLLTCTSTLPNAEEISAQLLGGGGGDDDDDEEDEEMEEGENNEVKKSDEHKPETNAKQPATSAKPDVANNPQQPSSSLLQNILNSHPHPTFATTNNEIEVSCINPRGKFLLSAYKDGIVLTNPKKREEQIPISSANNVKHVIWFRKPEDYKKVQQLSKNGGGGKKKGNKGLLPGHMVLICLEEETAETDNAGVITFRNKPLKQVCFQLPSYAPPPSTNENSDADNDTNTQLLSEEQWWNGLSSALLSGTTTKDGIVRVNASAMDNGAYLKGSRGKKIGYVFQAQGESGSTTTTQGMPYVGCYQGFNDGALFPLKEGLLFFKPPLFVPRSKLASISCGRGSGGSRYVDMVVQLDISSDPIDNEEGGNKKKKKQSDTTLEFTNIHRDELTGLNDYIHNTLIPAMQMDADGTGDGDSGSDDDDDDDDEAVAEVVNASDDEDESNASSDEDDEEEEEEGIKVRRRPSRAASKSAREITRAALKAEPDAGEDGDDSDDSEEFEESGSDDESEDESVVSDGESNASSGDGEFEEEDSDDDEKEVRKSKKARVG